MDLVALCQLRFLDCCSRRVRLASCLFAVIAVPLLLTGCLSFSIGGNHSTHSNEDPAVLAQSGTVTIPAGPVHDVYYPIPYASPPNLELDDPLHACEIVEQKADHFRVRINGVAGSAAVKWNASGVRLVQQVAAPQPNPPETSTSTPNP